MKTIRRIPEKDWQWHGLASHFICGRWCRFHMATVIGQWLVSSVGMYVHPSRSGASEKTEGDWLTEHPNGEEIGCTRFYETMVFRIGKGVCSCGCGLPDFTPSEVDADSYNTVAEATKGHNKMCQAVASVKWQKEHT